MSGRRIVRGAVLALAVAASLVVGGGGAQAAVDPAVSACGPGQDRNIGSQSTGAGAGKVTFNPFSIKREGDRPACTDEPSGDVDTAGRKSSGGSTSGRIY